MYSFQPPSNRIHLMCEKGYLKGLMVAQTSSNFSKLYTHLCSSSKDALRFCSMAAAQSFAKALNDHPGGDVWNAVDLGPEGPAT